MRKATTQAQKPADGLLANRVQLGAWVPPEAKVPTTMVTAAAIDRMDVG